MDTETLCFGFITPLTLWLRRNFWRNFGWCGSCKWYWFSAFEIFWFLLLFLSMEQQVILAPNLYIASVQMGRHRVISYHERVEVEGAAPCRLTLDTVGSVNPTHDSYSDDRVETSRCPLRLAITLPAGHCALCQSAASFTAQQLPENTCLPTRVICGGL